MKEIPLTRGLFAKIDDEFYNEVIKHKWYADIHKTSANPAFYARRNVYGVDENGKRYSKAVMLHRYVMELSGVNIDGKFLDHKNRDTLDDRLENLRIATPSENTRNTVHNDMYKNEYKGVHWSKAHGKFMCYIYLHRRRIHLGFFNDAISAAKKYNEAALKYHGEFARLNNI